MLSRLLTAAAFAAVSLLAPAAQASSLKISGSTTVASAILLPMEQQIEDASGVDLDIIANGSSRGINDLINGQSALAMISAPLDVAIKKINKKAPGSLDGADLRGYQIGETRVAFVVHPSNPVGSMTLEQVAGILSGQLTNWSELGGADMPIVIVAETLGGGVRTLVESKLNNGESIAGTVREFPNATQVPKVVAQMPQAFGLASFKAAGTTAAVVVETNTQIAQPLILVTNGAPSDAAMAVIEASRDAAS